jgi:hypothetical protein
MTLTQANPANQTNLRKFDKFLGLVLIASALLVALYFTTKANLDLTEGRYALHGDERITFDGVRKLLHPGDLLTFIDTVIDGKDTPYPHIYGRILWNISAIFAFLPERLWGVSGQIIATRFTHAIIQLLAYGLLVFTLIRFWILRGLALLLLVALPYTAYFATMPKPEPIQLLCLALFLAFSAKNQFRFGYYWVFLGLAFGAKISALTIIPLFIAFALLVQTSKFDWVDFPVPENQTWLLKKTFRLGLILLGIYQFIHAILIFLRNGNTYIIEAISDNIDKIARRSLYVSDLISKTPKSSIVYSCIVSILLLGFTLISIPYLTRYLERKSLSYTHSHLKAVGLFLLGFCVAIPAIFFRFPLGLFQWFFSTFLTRSHESDDKSITIYSWVKYIFSDYLPVPPFLLFFLFLGIFSVFLLLLIYIIRNLKSMKASRQGCQNLVCEFHPFIPLLISLFSTFPIFVSADRLWGHYLHVATVFFAIAIFTCCENLLISNLQTHSYRRWVLTLVVSILSVQTLITVFYMMPAMATEMNSYAQRTSTPEFQQQNAEYDYLVNLFQSKASSEAKSLNIYGSVALFIPDSTKDWKVTYFSDYILDWQWQAKPDLVVMYRRNNPLLLHQPPSTSASYELWLAAKDAMVEHLSTADQTCAVKPCYLELSSPHPELLILAKQS